MKINKKILMIIFLSISIPLIYFNFIKHKDFYYAGTIEGTKIDISSRITSIISTFPAIEGHKVKKNEMLVSLACEDVKLNFDLAKRDFIRDQKLYKMGSLSEENFDHARGRKDDLAIKLDWCSITSKADATILNTYREVGEYVTPGTKLLTLINLSEVWAIIYVPQTMLAKLNIGQKVKGHLPELNQQAFDGVISYISDNAEFTPKNVQTEEERTRLVFGIKITFSNPKEILKPGMTVEIKLD